MTLKFTETDKLKFNIFQQGVKAGELNDSELPTDIHMVEYEVNGKLYCDAVRAYKVVDVFDGYYDKLKQFDGTLISITNGHGKLNPKLYQGNG